MFKSAYSIAGVSLAVVFSVAVPASAQLLTHKDLSVATATTIAMTAIDTCKSQGYNVSANVLGREGQVVVAIRNPAAGFATFENSMKKAYTSRAFDITTKDLATHSQSGGQFFGIHASNDGKVMIFAGGIPLKRDGKVVGAVGVSGGSGDQDHAVAEAGAGAF